MLNGCSKSGPGTAGEEESNNEIVIDINAKQQVIRNFGASDAWACQFVGLWPDEKKKQVADWLFSMENDGYGQPKGIGLSLWRFNIGAGSVLQNNISDDWRRAEGFLNDDLTYDWSRQAGQRWFMNAAKERGVNQFVGFTNSPPVPLTKNGKAYSDNGERANIDTDKYPAFAKFLADVAKKFRDDDVPFTYLSPFNEPQWDWTGNGQEGSPYTNEEIFAITKILDSIITKESVGVKIQVAEAGKLNYLFEKADKATRGDQINTFFNDASPLFLGNMPNVDHVITGHSYFTSAPDNVLKSTRENVKAKIKSSSVPLEFWQSEYCVLGDQEGIPANGKDTGIGPGLYIARVIHHDLVMGGASAWHWWLAVSAYDYKDGLVYVEKNKTDGVIEDSKMLWALGNFSRFIRPGATRLSVESDNRDVNSTSGLMVSSYLDNDGENIVTVIVNSAYSDSTVRLETVGGAVVEWKPYLTGAGPDEKLKPLSPIPGNQTITVPKRSIITLLGKVSD
jgi:O-glycosyl hydrolase